MHDTRSLVCSPGILVAPDAEQTHLWADSRHLTTAGQTIESDYIYSLLTAPSQISLMAESAVQGGLARASTIQQQIDISGQHRGPNGINVWVSAGASALTVKNAPNFPTASGPPFGGTVGADYLFPGGVIVGAAFTAGGHDPAVLHRRRLHSGPARRSACMPPTGPGRCGATRWRAMACCRTTSRVRCRSASSPTRTAPTPTDSRWRWRCAAAAISRSGGSPPGRWWALVLQQVRLNGFTETGTSGVTALSFGGQTREFVR